MWICMSKIHICVYIYTYLWIFMSKIHICVYMYTYLWIGMSKIHIYIFVSMYVSNAHICIYVYIFVNMYVKNTYIHTHILACMNTCIHACMHSYIHSFITYLTLHCLENYISLHTSRNIMEYLVCVYIYICILYIQRYNQDILFYGIHYKNVTCQACMLRSQKLLAVTCASALLSLAVETYSKAMPVICAELEKGLSALEEFMGKTSKTGRYIII